MHSAPKRPTCNQPGCTAPIVLRVCRGTRFPEDKGYWYEACTAPADQAHFVRWRGDMPKTNFDPGMAMNTYLLSIPMTPTRAPRYNSTPSVPHPSGFSQLPKNTGLNPIAATNVQATVGGGMSSYSYHVVTSAGSSNMGINSTTLNPPGRTIYNYNTFNHPIGNYSGTGTNTGASKDRRRP